MAFRDGSQSDLAWSGAMLISEMGADVAQVRAIASAWAKAMSKRRR